MLYSCFGGSHRAGQPLSYYAYGNTNSIFNTVTTLLLLRNVVTVAIILITPSHSHILMMSAFGTFVLFVMLFSSPILAIK